MANQPTMFQAAYCGDKKPEVSIASDERLALKGVSTHVVELSDKHDKIMSARAADARLMVEYVPLPKA